MKRTTWVYTLKFLGIFFVCSLLTSAAFAAWVQEENPDAGLDQLRGVGGTAEDDVYAVGDYGTILHNDGTGWSEVSSFPGTRNYYGIWGSASDTVYIVGDRGEIYNYDGSAWSRLTSPNGNRFRDVWGTAADDIYAVGDKGTIVHYDGSSWDNMTAPANTPTLQEVWGTAWDNIYAVGGSSKSDPDGSYEAVIIHYDGSTWTTQWTGVEAQKLKAVWGSSETDIYAVGDYGTILHTADGTNWSEVLHGITYDGEIRSMWGSSATDIFAAGDYTTIFHYDGTGWSDVSSDIDNSTGEVPGNLKLHGMWGVVTGTGSKVYTVGGDIGTILLNDRTSSLVELVDFSAEPSNRQVLISWETAAEIDNAGFNLLRAEAAEGPYEQLNAELIAAEGAAAEGAVYRFIDNSVQNRTTYYYMLEDIDADGISTQHGPVTVTPLLIYEILP